MYGWMDCLGGHCEAGLPDLTKASLSHEKLFSPTDKSKHFSLGRLHGKLGFGLLKIKALRTFHFTLC